MVLRFFVFHENDLKTKFPLVERSVLDDTIMSKAGILPTCAVISLFLSLFVFLVNLLRYYVVEADATLSQKVSALLPLGPFAFLFGDEYKELINDKYFNIKVIESPVTTTPTSIT